MCDSIRSTTVCLLCPLGNKPLGHLGCPYGIANAAGGSNHKYQYLFPQSQNKKWKLLCEEDRTQTRLCSNKFILSKRENETCFVNFSHMCCIEHVMNCVVGKRVIIFDIVVTFGHCQKAINKGVATLGYTYTLAHSLFLSNFPLCIFSQW